MRMSIGVILVAIAQALTGCGGWSPTPVAPSPVVSAGPPAGPVLPQTLSGYVGDTGFRPVGGARIDVLDGQHAGLVMTSESDGHFSYPAFAGPASMRATREGYTSAVSSVIFGTDRLYVFFDLAPVTPPVRVAGNYTLTLVADSACTSLPAEARTRTYSVAIAANPNSRAPTNTYFQGTATSATFAPNGDIFFVGVAGNYVAVSMQGEGPSLIEQIGPNRFVAYYGVAAASVATPEVSTISAPFTGSIEYCELKSPIAQYYDCSPELAAVREACTSNGQLTLVRR